MIPFVKRFKGPHDCWEYLREHCQAKLGSKKLMLLKIIVFMRKENSSMDYYFKEVREILDQFGRYYFFHYL
jgi:hypothetical protein